MKKKVKTKKLSLKMESKKVNKSHHKKPSKTVKIPISKKQRSTTTPGYENNQKKRSWFSRLIPLILLIVGFIIGSYAQNQQDPLFIVGLVLFILGFFLLPMLVQRKNFGWWMWGIIFFIVSLMTLFTRGIKLIGGTVMINNGFVIGGIFFLVASLICMPITFNKINKSKKINPFVRTVVVLLCYICAVLFSFFTQ